MEEALKLAYSRPESKKQEITGKELREFLRGKRITLDCGHHFQLHPLSNTLILHCNGTTECHS